MNCQMVLNNTNKNNSILLEVFASVFTVSSYFTDNPRMLRLICEVLSKLAFKINFLWAREHDRHGSRNFRQGVQPSENFDKQKKTPVTVLL